MRFRKPSSQAEQKSAINERVIREMERLLERQLTPEEIRLLLLSEVARRSVDQDAAA